MKHYLFCKAFSALIVQALLFGSFAYADTIYVSCHNSGTIVELDSGVNSPTSALGLSAPCSIGIEYPTIQSAINAAVNGDTVVISSGIYTGDGNRDIDFMGKAITVRSSNPNDPNIVAATIIDCNGSVAEPHGGFYFQNNEGPNSVLTGLTIIKSYITPNGAIYCYNSSPTILSCVLRDNTVPDMGGAVIYSSGGNPSISKCTITENLPEWPWSLYACCSFNGSVNINQNTFSNHSLAYAFSVWGSSSDNVIISQNTFVDNGISLGGYLQSLLIENNIFEDFGNEGSFICRAAISISGTSNNNNKAVIRGNIFSNFARSPAMSVINIGGTGDANNSGIIEENTFENIEGYAINLGGTGEAVISGIIRNNTFRNCGIEDDSFSGAVNIGGTGDVTVHSQVRDNLFTGCCTGIRIGGMSTSNQFGIFENNTFVNNAVGITKGDLVDSLKISNCTLWDNETDLINVPISEVTYSDINDVNYAGTNGNISIDPLFVDNANSDYNLPARSPCVDAGDPNYVAEPNETDLGGQLRVMGGRIDMGAYELFPCPYVITGDLDGDCKVDFYDFAALADNWLIDCWLTPNNPACVPK